MGSFVVSVEGVEEGGLGLIHFVWVCVRLFHLVFWKEMALRNFVSVVFWFEGWGKRCSRGMSKRMFR